MKRKALLLLFTAVVVFALPASAQTYETLFAFTGFDYQDPNPVIPPSVDHADYLAVGEGYNLVGFVTQFGPLLTPWVDTGTFEYTHYLYNEIVSSHIYGFGFLEVKFVDGGLSRYYADKLVGGISVPATYGTFPPNATSPSTFIDGSMRIGGTVTNFKITYDFNTNQGNLNGDMTLDTGADLIYIPAGQRAGWTLAGQAGRPNATIPNGYDNQVTGECKVLSVPVTHKTWGALKALYR